MSQEKSIPEDALTEARLAVLGQFSTSLVHDLRNPLTVIRNVLYFLRDSAPATPEVTESLDMIDSEVKELNAILTRLMEITHDWHFEPSEVHLESMLQEIAASMDTSGKVVWRYDLRLQPGVIWCDRTRFQQVLHNLFRNSLNAMKGRGEISIAAWREGDQDIIEVRDTGPGVASSVQSSLFQPFVTSRSTGMGLGLTYSRSIVQRHGGTIDLVESSPSGAAFRIVLPRKGAGPA